MSRTYDIALRIKLQNGAQGLKRFQQEAQRDARATARALDGLTRSSRQLEQQQRLLGDRTRSVVRSLRDFVNLRAPQALISGVQRLQTGMRALQGAAGAAAGVAAGGYVMARPISRTMDYSLSLANLANVAYADSGLAGRKAGKQDLDRAIRNAVRTGGGSRETALDALNSLISQGMDRGAAMRSLPSIMKTSTAANADPLDIANLVMKARTSGGIGANQVNAMLDQALMSGQMGGFELKDMARWLPRQMASAQKAGMTGMSDLNVLLSANQAAIATAGSADEAGNNVANLLNKITSMDAQRDAKRLGIDLAGTLAAGRAKGIDPLTAFANLADQVASKDPRFNALQAKAASASTPADKRAIYQQQAAIFAGSSLGQLIQDQEATKALVAIMGQRDEMKRQQAVVSRSQGTVNTNFALIADESSFKMQQAKNEKAFAETDAFSGLADVTGDVAQSMAELAAANPKLAAATVAATTALAALAATAAASSIGGLLMGGGGRAGAAKGLLKRLGMGAIMAGVLPAGSVAGAGAAGLATAAGGLLAAGGAGYAVGSGINWLLNKASPDGEVIGSMVAHALALFGNEEAKRAIELHVSLDGQQVAATVTQNQSKNNARQ